MRIANKLAVLALLSTVVGTRAIYAVDQKTFASPAEAVRALVKAAGGRKPGRDAGGSGR